MIPLAQDAVIGQAPDGTITSWDACAARLFGFAAEEAIGKSITIIFPADRLSEAEGVLDRVRCGETVVAFETVGVRKDGTRVEIALTSYPARDAHGRVSTVVRDLGELRRASEARAHLAAIIDGSDDAIVSKDLDGRILSWNRSAERIFGYTAAEVIGQSITLIIPEQRRVEEDQVLAQIRRGEIVDHFETQRLRKDGSLIDISLTVSPVRDDFGRITGASKIARDVTERKRIEQERDRLYEQELRSNRAKDEFLAMLSHELRNPIGAISSALHVLGIPDAEPDLGSRARDIIGRQARHLTRIVDDLLDVARVISGKIRLDPQPMDLGEAVTSAVNALRISGRAEQHVLELDVTRAPVVGDFVRIEQIAGNLLDNALKYTAPGGTIRVTVKSEAAEAVFQVEDTGVGIPKALLADVFEMFVQGERQLDRAQGGLGIGLTLVRQLVGLHDGSVEAFSEGVGHGSRFTVRLRAAPKPESNPIRHRPDQSAPRRVLLVEDDRDTSEMLRNLLQWSGHQVFEAHDGEQGIEAALRLEPDVALIDIGLPEVDGYEVARQIRQKLGVRPMLLVAITGYGRSDDQRRSAEAGFDLHLVKPVDVRTLDGILSRSRKGEGRPHEG